MEGRPTLEDTVRQIFASRGVAVLATQGREYPHACLVAFVATKDLKHIFFMTGRSTRKFDNMCRDGRVMFLVDDRANTEKDFDTATVVTGRGKAVPAHSKAVEEMFPLYLSRHPHLEAFAKKKKQRYGESGDR